MGIFSAKKARSGASKGDIAATLDMNKFYYKRMRDDAFKIGPTAFENRLAGSQAATSLFQQSYQPQMAAFQQGNIGAQETLTAGLPQQINAILGKDVDLSGLQAKGLPTDMSFLTEAQAPEFDMSALTQEPREEYDAGITGGKRGVKQWQKGQFEQYGIR